MPTKKGLVKSFVNIDALNLLTSKRVDLRRFDFFKQRATP